MPLPTHKHDTRRRMFVDHAVRFIGKPYIWGGQGPLGLDCSGLVVECMRACGLVSRTYDDTAQGLYLKYRDRIKSPNGVLVGDLVFYGKNVAAITHIGIVVAVVGEEVFTVEAVGGRRGTQSPEDAQAHQAMVTIRPMRDDAVAAVNLF
jgi:hypothetical protein